MERRMLGRLLQMRSDLMRQRQEHVRGQLADHGPELHVDLRVARVAEPQPAHPKHDGRVRGRRLAAASPCRRVHRQELQVVVQSAMQHLPHTALIRHFLQINRNLRQGTNMHTPLPCRP